MFTKLHHFDMIKVEGKNALDHVATAEVTYTTGIWPFKKVHTGRIRREYGKFWYFAHNGEYTPGDQAEALQRVWEAKYGSIWEYNGVRTAKED